MKKSVKQELKKIKEEYENSSQEFSWSNAALFNPLSEDFIREFKDKIDWLNISKYQTLSEEFIREFKDKIDWLKISSYQTLSEGFIREFKDKVDWCYISTYQVLSEGFIREFKDKVWWENISISQVLSESFIREFKDEAKWSGIIECQNLSKSFIEKYKNIINTNLYNSIHKNKSLTQKRREVKAYAKRYNLEIDKNYLYAYRNHDELGRGMVKPIRYQKGIYYKDWHCDMRKSEENSFGFGIWPKGNTKVRVKIEDWGVAVNREDGKARVWGFEII